MNLVASYINNNYIRNICPDGGLWRNNQLCTHLLGLPAIQHHVGVWKEKKGRLPVGVETELLSKETVIVLPALISKTSFVGQRHG